MELTCQSLDGKLAKLFSASADNKKKVPFALQERPRVPLYYHVMAFRPKVTLCSLGWG